MQFILSWEEGGDIGVRDQRCWIYCPESETQHQEWMSLKVTILCPFLSGPTTWLDLKDLAKKKKKKTSPLDIPLSMLLEDSS